jgi:hypothetical protein
VEPVIGVLKQQRGAGPVTTPGSPGRGNRGRHFVRVRTLGITGSHGGDSAGCVVRDAEVGPLMVAQFVYYRSLSGGVPAATTEKAVAFPVMALWVAGCVVVEGTVAVATAAIVIVDGEVEESLTREMEPEALSVEAGENLPVMVVFWPLPMELNPTQPE